LQQSTAGNPDASKIYKEYKQEQSVTPSLREETQSTIPEIYEAYHHPPRRGVLLEAFELEGAALRAGDGGKEAETEGKGERENQAPCGVAGVLGVVLLNLIVYFFTDIPHPQVSPTWTFLFLNLYAVYCIYSYSYPPSPLFFITCYGGWVWVEYASKNSDYSFRDYTLSR